MSGIFSTARLARGSARHPWLILLLWVLFIVGAGYAQSSLKGAFDGPDELTSNPDSKRGEQILEDRMRGPEAPSETVIVRSDTLTVDDPSFRAEVDRTLSALRGFTTGVASATSYFDAVAAGDPNAESMVSADRHTTVIPVALVGDEDSLTDYEEGYVDLVDGLGNSDVQVLTVGDASGDVEISKIVEEDIAKGETIGVAIALVVLIVVFGALVAAGLPLLLGIVSIFVTLGLATVVGQFYQLTDVVTNIVSMIGLAVGIDYSLFVVERFREEGRRGLSKLDAIERAGATASKAVVFSGLTVIVALLGMFLLPVTVFQALGIGAALVVLVAMAGSLTLVPALLSLLGDKINWPRRRRKTAVVESAHDPDAIFRGFWGRITRVVMARPWISAVLASGLLLVAAINVRDLNTGQTGVASLPDSEVKTAYEVLASEFYAGMIGPVEIVVDGNANDPPVQTGIQNLVAALSADGIYGPANVETNSAGDVTLLTVPMSIDPDSAEAEDAVKALRSDTIPAAFEGSEAKVYVTGDAAFSLDFNDALKSNSPLVFAFVLGLSFLLLMLAFRSIVVPLKAIILNLLSVGAAYGLLVLVFQKGVGADFFGFQETPVITAWTPIFLFCILFGLSMDYHVFLLSRIREHYDLTKRNSESVAFGLHSTAKIITGAAVIMVAVFSGFAMGRLVDLQQMGFGLAAAVFIDATIVRSILVPAGMALLGDRNWYLPRWLHWLPDLRIEGTPEPALAGAASAAPASAVPSYQSPRTATAATYAYQSAAYAAQLDTRSLVDTAPATSKPVARQQAQERESRFLRIIAIPFEARTYRSIGYLLASFPLGIAYFVILILGFTLGIGGSVGLFGVPVLLLTFGLVWKLMSFERRMAGGVLGEAIPQPFAEVDRRDGFWQRLKGRLGNAATYKGIAFLFAKLPVGIVSLVATVLALSIPAALLMTIVTFPFDGARPDFFGQEIDTPQKALACAILSPIVALFALHALVRLARLFAGFARSSVGGRAEATSGGD